MIQRQVIHIQMKKSMRMIPIIKVKFVIPTTAAIPKIHKTELVTCFQINKKLKKQEPCLKK